MPRKPSVPTCSSHGASHRPRCAAGYALPRHDAGLALRTLPPSLRTTLLGTKGNSRSRSVLRLGQGKAGLSKARRAVRRRAAARTSLLHECERSAPRRLRAASAGATGLREEAAGHAAHLQGFRECGKMPHYDSSTVAFCYTIQIDRRALARVWGLPRAWQKRPGAFTAVPLSVRNCSGMGLRRRHASC